MKDLTHAVITLSLASSATAVRDLSSRNVISSVQKKTHAASSQWSNYLEQLAWSGYESAFASQDLKKGVEIDPIRCDIERMYTARPDMCPEKVERWNYADLEVSLLGFTQLWKEMQTAFSSWGKCCMGFNHRFVVYHLVTNLKPSAIIESGVAAGYTTWLLRKATGPNTPIFSMDPADPSLEYNASTGGFWKDAGDSKTTYFTSLKFQDLAAARWDQIIPDPDVRARTLVILDDHQSTVERLKMMQRWGFKYFYYDDNYPYNIATTDDPHTCKSSSVHGLFHNYSKGNMFGDAYSPNTMCASLPSGTTHILHKDQFGSTCKWLTVAEHMKNVHWMQQNLADYFEFPAAFSPCQNLTRPPLLGTDPLILSKYGFPPPQGELWHYGHLYPPFIELKPLNPLKAKRELALAIDSTKTWIKKNSDHWVR